LWKKGKEFLQPFENLFGFLERFRGFEVETVNCGERDVPGRLLSA
jgi:hypothetical protein